MQKVKIWSRDTEIRGRVWFYLCWECENSERTDTWFRQGSFLPKWQWAMDDVETHLYMHH